MGRLLKNAETKSLDALSADDWSSDLQTMATNATDWFIENGKPDSDNVSGELPKGVTTSPAEIVKEGGNAVDFAVGKLNNRRNGVSGASTANDTTNDYQSALYAYEQEGLGNESDFQAAVAEKITGGSVDGVTVSG
jgi:hypothetical protein